MIKLMMARGKAKRKAKGDGTLLKTTGSSLLCSMILIFFSVEAIGLVNGPNDRLPGDVMTRGNCFISAYHSVPILTVSPTRFMKSRRIQNLRLKYQAMQKQTLLVWYGKCVTKGTKDITTYDLPAPIYGGWSLGSLSLSAWPDSQDRITLSIIFPDV